MTISFKIEGLSECYAALHELPKATAKNVALRVLKKRAKPILDAAEAKAPVASGKLKKSMAISTKLSKRQKSRYKKDGPNDVDVFIGAGALPEAHMQEFGTTSEPAQPFLRPAWDALKDNLTQQLADDMWVEIERAVTRLARKAAKT